LSFPAFRDQSAREPRAACAALIYKSASPRGQEACPTSVRPLIVPLGFRPERRSRAERAVSSL